MVVIESVVVYRNNSIREFVYDFGSKTVTDMETGEKKAMTFDGFRSMKADLKSQGFRFLMIDPRNVVFDTYEDALKWCERQNIPMCFTPNTIQASKAV